MANEQFDLDYLPESYSERNSFAVFAFTCLLLLVFVGLRPFSPPVGVASFGGAEEAGSGNTLRQIAYASAFFLIVINALFYKGWAAFRGVPLSIVLLLGWCALSAFWAEKPDVVLRRAALEIVLVLSIFIGVETVGAERALKILRVVLGIVLIVNLLSIPFVSAAVHPPTENDVNLIGNWRGLYGHKNIAGAVCAVTVMLFLFTKNGKGNWIGIAVAICATFFLIMSHSKSSLGFLPVALLAGWLYHIGWRDGLDRAILAVAGLLLLLSLVFFASLESEVLTRFLEDPAEFTGRAAIWQAELAYINDHPLLGAGFGSFTDTGGLSPLHNYVSSKWIEEVSHGHNGYLQLLVTIGGVGFLLAAVALIIPPTLSFWKLELGKNYLKPLLFVLFCFSLLHNAMESDFLEADGAIWSIFLLTIACLRQTQLQSYSEAPFAGRAVLEGSAFPAH